MVFICKKPWLFRSPGLWLRARSSPGEVLPGAAHMPTPQQRKPPGRSTKTPSTGLPDGWYPQFMEHLKTIPSSFCSMPHGLLKVDLCSLISLSPEVPGKVSQSSEEGSQHPCGTSSGWG